MIVNLEDLEENDLRELKNRIEYILLTKGNKANEYTQDLKYMEFYKFIVEELSKKLNQKQNFNYWWFKKKNPALFKKLKESYTLLYQYQVLDCSPTIAKKFQLLAFRLLSDYLQQIPVPLSITTILNNFNKVPGLIDIAYPEYAENNLLHKII